MNLRRLLPLLFVVTACTEETPTNVGGGLITGRDVRTFEVILEPDQFVDYDTAFTGYTTTQDAPFALIASKFGGVVDANLLLRLAQPPVIINVRNAAGTIVPDSNPQYFEGRLVIRFDTVRSTRPPAAFRAFRTAEPWDLSATWTLRVDTGAVELPWQTPGGTRGAQIDTATWAAGDSMVFRVDSQTIAEWRDTANHARGALIVGETPNTRVRIAGVTLRLNVRSTIRPDTIQNIDVPASLSAFIFNPPAPPTAGELRVGGVPSWRAMIGISENMRNLTFPCPGVANCTIRLDRAHVNLAELLLQPATAPPGFIPEDSTIAQARGLLVTPGVPLQRSPLSLVLGNSDILRPSWFGDPPAAAPVRINITNYILAMVAEEVEEANRPPSAIALVAFNEPATFGFVTFAGGPRLRLVLTAPVEVPID